VLPVHLNKAVLVILRVVILRRLTCTLSVVRWLGLKGANSGLRRFQIVPMPGVSNPGRHIMMQMMRRMAREVTGVVRNGTAIADIRGLNGRARRQRRLPISMVPCIVPPMLL
jgi:hypothetical protein